MVKGGLSRRPNHTHTLNFWKEIGGNVAACVGIYRFKNSSVISLLRKVTQSRRENIICFNE